MALPTFADAKRHLRIEHADEDQYVTQLVAYAKAVIERAIGYPFVAVEQTFTDYAERYAEFLQLPGPFALATPPVVTDVNGGVIDSSMYILDARGGKIRAPRGSSLASGRPYTVVATIGLSAHPDAATLEAVASAAILDLVSHLYQNRNPAIESESDEGGGSVSLSPEAIPPRIWQSLMLLPCTS